MPSERPPRLALSALVGGAQRLLQALTTIVAMPLMLRALGSEGFGSWGAVTSLAWLTGVASLGLSETLITALPVARSHERTDEAREHVTAALALTGLFGAAALVVVGALAVALPGDGDAPLYLLAALALALNVPLSIANSLWIGLQKAYVAGGWETVQTVVTTAGLFAAAACASSRWVFVACVYGGVLLSNVGSFALVMVRHPELRPRRAALSGAAIRFMASPASRYFVLHLANVFALFADNVLAMELLGPEASAKMAIVFRVCFSAIGVLGVMAQPLWPAFARAAAASDVAWMRRALARGTLVIGGLGVAGAALLVSFGPALLGTWLHGRLDIDPPLLRAMGAWIIMHAVLRVTGLLMNAVSAITFQVYVALGTGAVAFALKFVLAPRLGVPGILWATTLAYLFVSGTSFVGWLLRWSRRPLDALSAAATAPR